MRRSLFLAKVIGKARTTITELLSLNALPDEIRAECRTSDIASKSVLIHIVRLRKTEDQLKYWSHVKQGNTPTVRAIREHASRGQDEITKPTPKPQKLFYTTHKASVIVQSETRRLTNEQVIGALEEALEKAKNSSS